MRRRVLAALLSFAAGTARAAEPAPNPARPAGGDDEPVAAPIPPPATLGTPADPTTVVAVPAAPAPVLPAAATPSSGLRVVLDGVEVRGNRATLTSVVLAHVPFRAGAVLDVDDSSVAATRLRLLATGYFRDVQLSLRKGSRRGRVWLVVTVVERNTIIVNELGLGVAAGAAPGGSARPLVGYGGIDVSENNLGGTGTILGGALAIADEQVGVRVRVARSGVAGSPLTLGAEVLFNQARDFFGSRDVLVEGDRPAQDVAVARYRRFGGRLSAGYELLPALHVALDYRLEGIDADLPAVASQKRGLDVEPVDFYLQRGGSLLSSVRASVAYDTRDEPMLATRGWFASLGVDGAFAGTGSSYSYFKVQGRAARWIRLPWRHVVKLELWGGAVAGDAPLFERFYVGDFTDLLPGRLLDLAFDRRSSPNFFGTAIGDVRYGDTAARALGEYRVPVYRGRSSVYGIDVFGNAGVYLVATSRELFEPSRRWQGAARVPIDLTFNFGFRIDTAIGGVNLGLSTLLGFLPPRAGAQ